MHWMSGWLRWMRWRATPGRPYLARRARRIQRFHQDVERDSRGLAVQLNARDPGPRARDLEIHAEEAHVEVESKVRERFIMLLLQALKTSVVSPV
jgi:hypothetical protein